MNVVVLPGDGIGPEVTAAAVAVMRRVAERHRIPLALSEDLVGGASIDAHGQALRPETVERCKRADAILFGAVGSPRWSDANPDPRLRPGSAILGLRRGLGLYANLRPVRVEAALRDASSVKADRIDGVDIMVVRELTGGLYFSKPKRRYESARGKAAVDTMRYSAAEVERVCVKAFQLARARRRTLCSVDKANVLETSRLWREVVSEVGSRYPEVEVTHMLVDSFAMQLIRQPRAFDVVVTENLFGDVLTDEASVLAGSLGMLPSASLGDGRLGLYEPIHGSAPDIAGRGIANPVGAILSVAMLFRHSQAHEEAAQDVERAVSRALEAGHRTPDIAEGGRSVTTQEMTGAILDAL
ncbi:MAG TPA: 3-isopropylmalate dehydrogenase [Candidatus Limnocylindrales bacterium]|nr:3-isopropylmalate dehydrogenase [Candidatus Limnocylindrales bacterium]